MKTIFIIAPVREGDKVHHVASTEKEVDPEFPEADIMEIYGADEYEVEASFNNMKDAKEKAKQLGETNPVVI